MLNPYTKTRSLHICFLQYDAVCVSKGADLIETSSELIHSGELIKVNSSGWSQDRVFFLFDRQMVYCKKVRLIPSLI